MSVVTNIILKFSILEDEKSRIGDVNLFFDNNTRGFVSCDDDSLPIGWYGGSKMLETPLFIGAFNYISLDDLLKHLSKVNWEYPQDVQLIVEEQEDDKFRIIELDNLLAN